MKRKLFAIFSCLVLATFLLEAQPNWVATTPSIGTVGPVSVEFNYGIDVTGTVYVIIFNSNVTVNLTPTQVKNWALAGPSGGRVVSVALPVIAGQENILLNNVFTLFDASRQHALYCVAENSSGTLQGDDTRLGFTTISCPPIDILTGFSQTGVCINNGVMATFQIAILDPATSGILKGTEWTLDWGDGTPVTTFTSAADNDIPPLALRRHTYTAVSNCNYVFSNSIRNPCGETRSVPYVAVVHGRDVPSDGDGILSIVNNQDGNPVIQVCEGIQKVITLRDNSTWNCQSPVLPGGITAIPNTDPRNIEWVYGRDPDGTIQNTINGTVTIASMGDAPQTSGRITPVPYGSSSLSQSITIPSTAQAGQYFRVYLKNWNKCNPGDLDFISTYVDIKIVAAPDPPQVDNETYCPDDAKTLTVNNIPTGDIIWYNSSMVEVSTGLTYTPVINTTGTFTYYVTDRDAAGLRCESVPTTVTVTVNPKPAIPTLSAPAKNDICYGVEPPETYIITATAGNDPPRTGFQWFRDGVLLPGRISDTIIISKPGESGRYTASSVGIPPSYCLSDTSAGKYITVHTLLNVTQPVDQVICEGGTAVFQAITTEEIASWQWEWSNNGGVSFSTVGNSAPYTGFNTNMLTITNPGIIYTNYWYRVEMKTPNGQGGCRFKSQAARLTIDQVPTANAGTPISLCRPAGMDPVYMTGATKGGTSATVIWSGGAGLGTWTQNDDPALAYFTPSVMSGSFTATLTITGTAACGSVVATGTRTITWAQTPAVEAGNNILRCDATPLAPITMTGASATGTYSGLNWTGGAGLGTWTQNPADPALAVFTPSIISGSFTATLTVTGTGACNGTNRTDTRIVSWGQTPAAVAGPALSRCDASPLAFFTMTGASASGTYTGLTWSGGAGLGTWTQNADPALARFTPTVSSGSFTALLSLAGTAGCTGQNVTVGRTIEWSHAATVNAGPDQSICALLSATLAGSFGEGATSASWVGGTGTFNPDRNTLNATYTPSAAETTAKTVTLTLTTNDPAGICPAVSDEITIAIGTLPTGAVLISSGDGCTGFESWLSIGITGGAPPYTFRYRLNGGPIQTVLNYESGINHNLGNLPAGVYTYDITEIRDFCNNLLPGASLPAPVSFQIFQNPVANAGSDKGVCVVLDAPLTAIPSVGTGTWSMINGPGVITFNPDVNNPAVTATATVAGTYVIRWTEVNAICSDFSDITVSYEKAADAGPSQNLCGTLSTILAGNVPASGIGTWTKVSGPGTVSFSPNVNTPNATATVSQYGTYVLKWTIANGIFCDSNDDVTFIFEVGADAGADQHLCNTFTAALTGNSPVSGTGAWSMVSGPGTVTFANATNPVTTATVTAYGNYVFNWKIDNGVFCTSNDNISVTYNPAGQAELPSNQVVCNGDLTTDVVFTSSNGSTIFTWTNSAPGIGLAASGSGNIAAFTAINNGTAPLIASIDVTPFYTDGVVNCPGPTRTFTITVNPTAQVNQPASLVICAGSPSGAINFETLNNPGTTSYSWTNDNNTIGLGDSGTGNIASFNTVNGGIIPVTATITVTPLYNNGLVDCTGPPETFTITVNPLGQINVLDDITLCHNEAGAVSFTTNNANGITTYSWTNSNPAIGLPDSGNLDNISFTATNAGTAPITGLVTVTPTFSNGGTSCPGTPETFTITVNPAAQVNQPISVTFCNGLPAAVAFTTNNTDGTTSYSWTNDNTDIGLGASGTGPLAFTANNVGAAPILANITVTPSFNNAGKDCPGPSKSFTITINPTPELSSSLTPTDVCSNAAFIYTPASSTGGTSFSWNRAIVAGITPAGPTSGVNGINETLRNVTNTPIAVTYEYTLSAGGCSSIRNVVVNVKPEPVIVPGQTSDLCSGNSTNYFINLSNFTNPGDNVTFTWNAPVLDPVNAAFSGGTARVSASSVNIQDAFLNTTGASGTATYTVTPYKNGCAGTPEDIVMTIRSQPVLSGSLNDIVCSSTATGLILDVAPGSVSADYYLILSRTLDAGLSADAGNAVINPATSVPAGYLISDKYLNLTGVPKNVTYRVQPVHAPDCYGTPADVVITINPEPYILPAQTLTICSGIAIGKEILLSPANVPAGTIFNWPSPTMSDASGQGTAGVNVTADPAGTLHINDVINNFSPAPVTATYYITATSTLGCSGSAIPVVITIKPEPMPKPITGRDKICINETNLIYEVAPTVGSTFHWTVDPAIGTKTFDFNTNAIILNAAGVPGTGNISVYETNSFACSGDPFTIPVQVYPQAIPEDIIGPTNVCANSTENYSVTPRAGSVYSWSIPGGASVIGDPSAATIAVKFGNVGGPITCRETNEAGCVTIHNPVTVIVRPLPTAIISGGGTICDGGTMQLFVDFAGTGPFDFTYAINGVPQAPVNTSSDPYTLDVSLAGTYTIVSVLDATGCNNTGFGSALVSYYPKPTGIISGDATVCGGTPATLTMTFTGTAPYSFAYTDGTTTFNVPNYPNSVYTTTVTPITTTTYTLVSLTDGNSCTGIISGSALITVNSPPVLTLTGTNLTCNNDNSGAVDLTATGNNPFGFSWTGPLGFAANTEDISGLKAGTYNVTVTDTKGCISTDGVTLTEPGALDATLASTNIFCFGSPEGTITISAPAGGSGSFEYTINGGATWELSGNYTGLNPGTFDVRIRDVLAPVCNKILNGALVLTGPPVLNANVNKTDIICYDAADGSINISNPTGGFGTYGYSINGGTTWQGSGNFPNLIPGFYSVVIRDASVPSCIVTLATIEITQPPLLSAVVNSTSVTCFGSSDGTITVSAPSGGSGTYEYSINGGGSWQASGLYNGVTPGTYNVQIRDAANPTCYKVLNPTLTIIQPDILKATVTSSMISCNGADDGTISITGSTGGSGSYEYTINGGIDWYGSGLFNSLAPGSFDIRIRDAANASCEIILNPGLDITEPPALSGNVVSTDITCFGAGDGTIGINNSLGGYGTYEYSIDGGTAWQSSNSFTNLAAGTYDVLMRDRIRTTCILSLDAALVISEPPVLSASLASTNVTCFNSNDGTITVSSASGGFGTYQYTVNGGTTWQGSGSFTNLSPGSYDVRMRDAASLSCYIILNANLVITQPPALSATLTKTNISCFGASDGTITVNAATGGYGTYEYTVDGGGTWQALNNFTGLGPGFYNVRIRDAVSTSCIYTVNNSVNVIEPAVLNATLAKTNVTCNGADDGSITISSPTGGYGTYEFSINGGADWQSSGSFVNLSPGTRDVKIRDAGQTGCIITLNPAVSITEPAVLSATLASTNITCFGANNGTITISGAAGGYGTYEYSINGGGTWSVSGNFSGLAPATYNVIIRDAANPGCMIVLNNSLAITQPPVLVASYSKTDITCFGAGDGTILISSPAGGYGTYEYTINGGGSWQNSGTYNGLGPGTYNVQMRDAGQPTCTVILNASLSVMQPSILNASLTTTMVTCNSAGDGIITISTPSGGSGSYEYTINGGVDWTATGLFGSLVPGTYDVRIRDAVNTGCVIILNSALLITEPDVLNATVSSTNITCNGSANGTITISGTTGGYGTFDYSIDGGSVWQATGSFTNLLSGIYDVRIRDRAHIACFKILDAAFVITEPALLSATVSSANVTCFGANNGTITVSGASGGYGTYQYSIDGGVTWLSSGNFTGLVPGSYNVRIRDAANISCFIILSTESITEPNILSASVTNTDVTCSGANDGTITITLPLGGYGTYEYTIDGGSTWQASGNFTGLAPGFYNVQIRDALYNTCVIILNGSLRITEPNTLSAIVTKSDITCNGAVDGKITISLPTGGYGTYEYSIDGGSSWQASGTYTGLVPGLYNVQMRDAVNTGCVAILNAALTISEPPALSSVLSYTDVTCNGISDGTITITGAAGGYGVYQYSIDGGISWFSSGLFTGLTSGIYDVRMRDASNTACFITLDPALQITEPALLTATVNSTSVSCYGSTDGTITITAPSGGYGSYEYSINGGGSWEASGSYTGLGPGSYNIRIRDAAYTGCYQVLNAALIISQPVVLNASVSTVNVSCNGASDGEISISSPTGGSGSYEYSVDGGITWQAPGVFGSLAPGIYNVQIRDASNTLCVIILNSSLPVTEPAAVNAVLTGTDISCFGADNGSITISFPSGGYGTYEYSINGGGSWESTGTYSNLLPGFYNVQVRDKAHILCVTILDGALEIIEPPVLSATVTSTDVTCFGAGDGTISVSGPLGGYGTYEYSKDGGGTWQGSGIFTGLAPSTYNVQVRDAAHTACVITLDAALVIGQPAVLSATVASTNVSCFNAADGTITVTAPSGGYGTYEYTIDGGITWQGSGIFGPLAPGFYNVQIRDGVNTGCFKTLNNSLRITEPSLLAAFISKTDVTCNGSNDGTISILSSSGGYGSYEYSINGGTTWQGSFNFTGLNPGSYNVQIRDAAHTACVTILDPALVISEAAALNATVTPAMITCSGANDGVITISSPTGGSGSYLYSVNGGTSWQGSGTFMNLSPGNYDVRIKDAATLNCTIILDPSLPVTEPPDLDANVTGTNVSCFGGSDGTITVSAATGGYGSYEFSINGGGSWQASGSFSGLIMGSYNILMRDALYTNCMKILGSGFLITQPGMLNATVTKTDITCFGANDGKITVSSPSGGYGTYEYSVDGGTSWQASGSYTGLVSSAYDVRIRDAANISCPVILNPNLVLGEPLTLTLTTTGDISLDCFGDTDGTGTFYVSGGSFPYAFSEVSNTSGAVLNAPGFNSQSFTGAGTGSVTVLVTDSHGCTAQATISITQPALLTPGTIGSDQVLCSGQAPAELTELTSASGGPGTYIYQWQYATSSTGTFMNIAGATSYQYTPLASATATLYYRRMISYGICGPVYSNIIEVFVNPLPFASLSGGETICPGQSSVLNVNITSGTGPYEIEIENLGVIAAYSGGDDITVTPLTTTTYRLLRVKDSFGCEVIAPSFSISGTAVVVVRELPAITSSPTDITTCEFSMISFNVSATGSDLTYQWFVDTGTGYNPLSDAGIYVGSATPSLGIFGVTRLMDTYKYRVEVSGCAVTETSADAVLTVNTVPEIIVQPKDSAICMNAGASFSVTATGTGITYQWQINNGSGFTDVTDNSIFSGATQSTLSISNAPGTLNNNVVRVIVSGLCGAPVYSNFVTLKVYTAPSVTTNPLAKAICEGGGPVSFSANGSGLIDSLRWQVFSGGIWTDIHDNAVYSGASSQQLSLINVPLTYNDNQYRLALKAKCTTTYTTGALLTVNSSPVVDFSAADTLFACGGVGLTINGNPAGGSGTYVQHTWTGDTGPLNNSFIESPLFYTEAPGYYSMNYRVKDSNGCVGDDDVTVNVDSPSADFIKSTPSGCTPLSVSFSKDMTGITKFWWDFGDGSPIDSVNAEPEHIFANSNPASIEYFDVSLTVQSPGGCSDTYTSSVLVYPEVDAGFTVSNSTVCSGGSISFTSSPGASRYFWDYGDGQSGYSPTETSTHLFNNFTTGPIVHTVTLTTTSFYNCTDTRTFDITVMPVPQPQFIAVPSTQVYNSEGNTVTFTNQTNAGAWTWLWKFGDGSTSPGMDPSHTYTGIGEFEVTLIVSNGNCSDSIMHPVFVTPKPPVADFDSIPSACEPLYVEITNTSLNTEVPGTTFRWDFGDGNYSTAKNPAYSWSDPGSYRVELTVTGPGGTSVKSQIVHVYRTPIASLSLAPSYVFVNDESVRFFNLSQGADYYLWDFGDGDTSRVREPFHKYMTEGVYDITLWAYSENGCSDMYVLSPGVTVEPAGELRFSTVFTPNLDGPVELDHLPTGGTEIDRFFYPPVREKIDNYKLQIFNRLGVLIFESRDINIPWNGYYKGRLCQQGVYVWYVEGKYANGRPFRKVGDVTLLH